MLPKISFHEMTATTSMLIKNPIVKRYYAKNNYIL